MKKLTGILLYALAVLGVLVFPSQFEKNRAAAQKTPETGVSYTVKYKVPAYESKGSVSAPASLLQPQEKIMAVNCL